MADYIKYDNNSEKSKNDIKTKTNKIKIIGLNSKNFKNKKKGFSIKKVLITFLILLFITSFIQGIIFNITPKIKVIPIKGVIGIEESYSIYGETISSRDISEEIYNAADDNSVKAILLDINSGGGSPVASDEISKSIEYAKKRKKVIALINDIGASGAYWIASTCNRIYVSPTSIVGSIGVTSASFGLENFIKEHNISYRRLVAGKYKDIGSPFREMEEDEKKILQEMLNEIHYKFIEHVAKNRNLTINYTKQFSEGQIYTGEKAIEIGLADEVGYYKDVIKKLKNETKSKLVVTYYPKYSTIEKLLSIFRDFKINLFNNNLIMT